MKAMVMAAGVGNRLKPLTKYYPKPMAPIANFPVMQYAIELLKKHNIYDAISNLHYLPQQIESYFGNGNGFGINLQYSREKIKLLGTAGGVKNNEWFFKDGTFITINGDVLTDIDLTKLIEFHKKKGSIATITLKHVEDVSKFGVVVTDKDNKIVAFQEKPLPHEALSNLVNTGIYVFEPEIFSLIPTDCEFDFGKEVFPMLVKMGLPFYGFNCDNSYWCDIGNMNAYREANQAVIEGRVKSNLKPKTVGNNVIISPSAQILGKTIIGSGCIIEENVIIKDSIILENTIIKEDSIIENSVILSDCFVEPQSHIKDIMADEEILETEFKIKVKQNVG